MSNQILVISLYLSITLSNQIIVISLSNQIIVIHVSLSNQIIVFFISLSNQIIVISLLNTELLPFIIKIHLLIDMIEKEKFIMSNSFRVLIS
jgi:hypothetical protein